jgi:hypothetical protein
LTFGSSLGSDDTSDKTELSVCIVIGLLKEVEEKVEVWLEDVDAVTAKAAEA